MKRLLVFVGLLLLAYVATGVYQIRPGEQAVVRRLGKALAEPRLPGLHIGLPWGLDRVDRVAVDEQRYITVGFLDVEEADLLTAPPGQVLTGDNNLIDVRMIVRYRVNPSPESVILFALNTDRVEGFLSRAAETAFVATLAGQRVDDVLLTRAANLEPEIQQQMASTLAGYPLGVMIESVSLTYAQPPVELADVFREVNRARTQKEIARVEAEAAQQTAMSVARNDARKLRTEAEVASHQVLSQARAEAHSFLALWQKISGYSAGSQNALLNLYLTEMQTILSRMQVRTLTDPNVDQTILMPLPEK